MHRYAQTSHGLDCCNPFDLGDRQFIRRIVDAAGMGGPPSVPADAAQGVFFS
jgi:hypothetical protein